MIVHRALFSRRLAGSVLLFGLAVSGCSVAPPPQPQPAFYRDLATPGTELDPASATAIINDYRKGLGLAPLMWDADLARLADSEARGLATRDALLTDGLGAARGSQMPGTLRRSVSGGYHTFADAFSGWRGSPGHDAVLRERVGRRLGIAAVARPGSRHRVYWVTLVRTD
jgi:uncharacterized protein YkwD